MDFYIENQNEFYQLNYSLVGPIRIELFDAEVVSLFKIGLDGTQLIMILKLLDGYSSSFR